MAEASELSRARDRLLGLGQRVRVDAYELLDELDEIDAALDLTNRKARNAELAKRVTAGEKLIDGKDLEAMAGSIEATLTASDALASERADDGWKIRNGLSRINKTWPRDAAAPSVRATVPEARAAAEQVALAAAKLTVPRRAKEHLAQIGVGKSLDFNATFEDELPSAQERRGLLQYLKTYKIGGVIDAERGLIYKLSLSRAYRIFTYVSPLLVALAGAGLLVGIGNLDNLGVELDDDWGLNNVGKLLSSYLFVLAGVLAHLIVENVKQGQSGQVPILAISDGLNWLHLRWVGLAMTIFPILITVIGLRALGIGSQGEDLGLYFFAGYSVDSVAGLVLTRFDTAASKSLRILDKRIKDDSEDDKGEDEKENGRGRPRRRRRRRRG